MNGEGSETCLVDLPHFLLICFIFLPPRKYHKYLESADAMASSSADDDLVASKTEGFKVGEKKTVEEYAKLGMSDICQQSTTRL